MKARVLKSESYTPFPISSLPVGVPLEELFVDPLGETFPWPIERGARSPCGSAAE